MVTPDLITVCERAWSAGDLSSCKPYGFDAATWIAVVTSLMTLVAFPVRHVLKTRVGVAKDPDLFGKGFGQKGFRNLCRAIKPYLDDNSRIFGTFGPNGGRGSGEAKVVRFELGVWHQARQLVVANNENIRRLISKNLSVVPIHYRPTFERWRAHIDAFSAHLSDDSLDYRDYQFPREVLDIVANNA